MRAEDLLDRRLRAPEEAPDESNAERDAEVAPLVRLARRVAQLDRANLRPETRLRIARRFRQQSLGPKAPQVPAIPPADPSENIEQADSWLVRQLASRLGLSPEDLCYFIGPTGAVQLGRFLGVPGYSLMFVVLGGALRLCRRLEGMARSYSPRVL